MCRDYICCSCTETTIMKVRDLIDTGYGGDIDIRGNVTWLSQGRQHLEFTRRNVGGWRREEVRRIGLWLIVGVCGTQVPWRSANPHFYWNCKMNSQMPNYCNFLLWFYGMVVLAWAGPNLYLLLGSRIFIVNRGIYFYIFITF